MRVADGNGIGPKVLRAIHSKKQELLITRTTIDERTEKRGKGKGKE
jgi:hypothetical protein